MSDSEYTLVFDPDYLEMGDMLDLIDIAQKVQDKQEDAFVMMEYVKNSSQCLGKYMQNGDGEYIEEAEGLKRLRKFSPRQVAQATNTFMTLLFSEYNLAADPKESS